MTITKDLKELRHAAPVYFGDNYDAVIQAAVLLFGKQNVKVNMKRAALEISDRININLNFSGNETKIYFESYILPEQKEDKNGFKLADLSRQMMKTNAYFRFFDLTKAIEYLELKAKENEFIKSFEG